jgi:hypothetical protein
VKKLKRDREMGGKPRKRKRGNHGTWTGEKIRKGETTKDTEYTKGVERGDKDKKTGTKGKPRKRKRGNHGTWTGEKIRKGETTKDTEYTKGVERGDKDKKTGTKGKPRKRKRETTEHGREKK